MQQHGWGCIVNTSSALGLVGCPSKAAYSESKHSVIGHTEPVALEVALTLRLELQKPKSPLGRQTGTPKLRTAVPSAAPCSEPSPLYSRSPHSS
ncbi:putative short chain dehydrogenase [Leishmania naiffi]|uniref:Short chain dehydrogenase n=1 Tax=Leishmania naiffi TaxID=5678 RepID=A0AAW3B8W4_9TRYP